MKKNIVSNYIINDTKFTNTNNTVTKPKNLKTTPSLIYPKKGTGIVHKPINNIVHVTYNNFLANPIKNY